MISYDSEKVRAAVAATKFGVEVSTPSFRNIHPAPVPYCYVIFYNYFSSAIFHRSRVEMSSLFLSPRATLFLPPPRIILLLLLVAKPSLQAEGSVPKLPHALIVATLCIIQIQHSFKF